MDIRQTNEENAQKKMSEDIEEESKETQAQHAASDKEVQQSVSSAYVADMFTRLEINQQTSQPDEQPKKKTKKKKKNTTNAAIKTQANDELTKSHSMVFTGKEEALEGSPLAPEKQKSVVVG